MFLNIREHPEISEVEKGGWEKTQMEKKISVIFNSLSPQPESSHSARERFMVVPGFSIANMGVSLWWGRQMAVRNTGQRTHFPFVVAQSFVWSP